MGCGRQACNASTAGKAVIEGLAILDDMWVVADPQDELFGQVVPKKIVENKWLFTHRGRLGVANWQGAVHSVRRQTKPASSSSGLEDCDDDSAPCKTSPGKEAGFAKIFVKKFLALPSRKQDESFASSPALAAAFAPLLAACLFGVASTLVALRLSSCNRTRQDSGPAASKARAAAASSTPVATPASTRRVESFGAGVSIGEGGSHEQDQCLSLGSRRAPLLLRKASSCQQLLALAEKDV